jgi:hypothetical protein
MTTKDYYVCVKQIMEERQWKGRRKRTRLRYAWQLSVGWIRIGLLLRKPFRRGLALWHRRDQPRLRIVDIALEHIQQRTF